MVSLDQMRGFILNTNTMDTKKFIQIVSYVVFASVGAGVMYGVWYVTEAEDAKHQLAQTEITVAQCQSDLVDARAQVELEKSKALR